MKELVIQKCTSNNIAAFFYRKHRVFLTLLLTFLSFTAAGQTKAWDRTFGGVITTHPEENIYTGESIRYGSASLSTIIPTPDGGYLLGGSSNSEIGGDKSQESRDANDYANVEPDEGPFYNDYWVVKINGSGNKVWDKTFGGDGYDILSAIVATPDGGFLLGGSSGSGMSGDKSEAQRPGGYCLDGRCPVDYWIVKIDGSGNKVWDKSFGGGGNDYLSAIIVTPEGGFLLAGDSDSAVNGDKTQANHGMDDCSDGDCPQDFWIVKIDGSGNKLGDKTYGGDDYDGLSAIVAAPDGGYLLGGTSRSGISGDKSEASLGEGSDYWILKINDGGNKVWDKTFGGNDDYEGLSAIVVTPDGGYLLGGASASGVSGDKSEASWGGSDFWILRIDGSGNKIWDKTLGGSNDDRLSDIVAAPDEGYLLGGSSSSPVSGDKSEPSSGGIENVDYWIVKVDDSGDKLWDKTLGGSDYDNLSAIVATPDESFLLGGTSRSGFSGGKSEATKGFSDYWVVKVKDETNPYCIPSMASGCAGNNFIDYFAFADLYYNAQGQGCQDDGYTKFYPFYDIVRDSNYGATVKQGQSYSVTLRSYSENGEVVQAQAFGVWIDYNDDKDFDDPGEFVYSSPEVGAEFTGTIIIPADATSGVRRLRVRSRPDGVFTASESCTTGNYGETQDYTIAIGYCAPYAPNSCGNGSYIDNFSFNTLVNNNSGCSGEGGYIYYEPTGTLTTTVQKGESYSISVQSGPVAQAFGVWLDYNNDRDFDDEGELVYASPIIGENYVEDGTVYSPSVSTEPFNGMVTIPASANTGPVRMRVRSNSFPFRGAEACATYDPDFPGLFSDSLLFGEIEDYTIIIQDAEEVEPPVFASFSPNKGLPGTMVTLRGANLLTTSSVSFNGAEASFNVINNTTLEAVVPAEATTGSITVTTTGGEVTSDRDFRVLQPSIFVFAPWRGYVGSKVIIVGENLSTAREVQFNGVTATGLTVYNDHLLKVTVPEGATTGRITVLLAGGGQVESSYDYTVIQPAVKAEKKAVVLAATATEQVITYPNPFTEGVTVSVSLQEEEAVRLVVYAASGQKVRELEFGKLDVGQHELKWDGTDSHGSRVSRGLYIYQLAVGGKITSGKLLKEK